MAREIVKLVVNVPLEIALKFPAGKIVDGQFGQQVMYSLVGEKIIYLDLGPAEKVNQLWVKPGETFLVIKRWTGRKGDHAEFDCWLSPATEKARAEKEMAAIDQKATATRQDLAGTLQASLDLANRKPPVPATAPSPKGTGTFGPVPAPVREARQIPTKRQYADAFALFLVDAGRATLAAERALAGEGGSVRFDSRDLAAIATSMFIAADKSGYLTWDGGE